MQGMMHGCYELRMICIQQAVLHSNNMQLCACSALTPWHNYITHKPGLCIHRVEKHQQSLKSMNQSTPPWSRRPGLQENMTKLCPDTKLAALPSSADTPSLLQLAELPRPRWLQDWRALWPPPVLQLYSISRLARDASCFHQYMQTAISLDHVGLPGSWTATYSPYQIAVVVVVVHTVPSRL